MSVSLEETKLHLRIEVDENEEDSLINGFIQAAEGYVSDYLGEGLPEPMPAPVRAAVLLLVGDLYTNRERVSVGGIGGYQENPTFQLLLNPYRSNEVF